MTVESQTPASSGVGANANGQSALAVKGDEKQIAVLRLIQSYRAHGHCLASLDPLHLARPVEPVSLSLSTYGLSDGDLDITFGTGDLQIGKSEASLREILQALQDTYCRNLAVEYSHLVDAGQRDWFAQRIEPIRARPEYSSDRKERALDLLVAADGLEKYLGHKYPTAMYYGLQGGDSLLVALDEIIQGSGSFGLQEIVIGMPHRGRLNVLVNTLGKKTSDLFDEFDGKQKIPGASEGDAKYHLGFSTDVMTRGGEVHLSLAFNPSHLELVSPVVQGSARAREDRRHDAKGSQVLPVTIHGDAAIAGQGVIMETMQMSRTRGFGTGGTIRIVLNNQIGFTTSRPDDARSTQYATDIAKMFNVPVLHANGDDPEAVLFVAQLALEYRMRFHRDVVIDLVCYRRLGHNEADEPSGTQPLMYQAITQHAPAWQLYAQTLAKGGVLSQQQAQAKVDEYRSLLDKGEYVAKSLVKEPNRSGLVDWTPYQGQRWSNQQDTGVDLDTLKALANQLLELPQGFELQARVAKVMANRRQMAAGEMPVDWGFAETMAYATLLREGHPVRVTGEDVGRGAYAHRHAVLHNQKDDSTYLPLQHLYAGQPSFDIYDSFLSELGVLGFQYGYAITSPQSLVVWEAQLGDFANGAQAVIDEFITSGEAKWGRLCGLTLLLPHGHEGGGPDHSSARLERFLQACADENMQVCVPSTPAQIYHLLRRQVVRPLRKPLVALTPKMLLHSKQVVSSLQELANGRFEPVLGEVDQLEPSKVAKVIFCSGKIYYHLLEKRREAKREDIAILRIEQLYPFPEQEVVAALAAYSNLERVVWCQEEPKNQGAWLCTQESLQGALARHNPSLTLTYAGRPASASPAVGYASVHAQQQEKLLRDAFESE